VRTHDSHSFLSTKVKGEKKVRKNVMSSQIRRRHISTRSACGVTSRLISILIETSGFCYFTVLATDPGGRKREVEWLGCQLTSYKATHGPNVRSRYSTLAFILSNYRCERIDGDIQSGIVRIRHIYTAVTSTDTVMKGETNKLGSEWSLGGISIRREKVCDIQTNRINH
jgi:hypothetical protein